MGLQVPSVSSSKVILIKTVRLFLVFSWSCEGEMPGKVVSKDKWKKPLDLQLKAHQEVFRMLTESCIFKHLWGTKPYTFLEQFHFHLFCLHIINSCSGQWNLAFPAEDFLSQQNRWPVIKKDFFSFTLTKSLNTTLPQFSHLQMFTFLSRIGCWFTFASCWITFPKTKRYSALELVVPTFPAQAQKDQHYF